MKRSSATRKNNSFDIYLSIGTGLLILYIVIKYKMQTGDSIMLCLRLEEALLHGNPVKAGRQRSFPYRFQRFKAGLSAVF